MSKGGIMSRKTLRTHGDILWVAGDLKCTFKTHTVTQIDNVTSVIVNKRYFPSKGTASDVGGMISANNKKNTVNDTRMELHKVTFTNRKKNIK